MVNSIWLPKSKQFAGAMRILVEVSGMKVRIDLLEAGERATSVTPIVSRSDACLSGGELASKRINHLSNPQTATVDGTRVNVSNFTNLINCKLKAFRDREEKDVLNLEFLLSTGKNTRWR